MILNKILNRGNKDCSMHVNGFRVVVSKSHLLIFRMASFTDLCEIIPELCYRPS